ncbi:class A beta-lactamase [Roseateles sp.]|uniref:class A beta-lactamase n=1 Tax=Roseateles sp. TaxID=1971397 RepID=UPI0032673E6A
MNRRNFASLALLALATTRAGALSEKVRATGSLPLDLAQRLREIERGSGGRLGVHILDTATGVEFSHRADERFLMCSTFKTLASALVLRRVDLGQESLTRRIVFGAADMVPNSPVSEQRVGGDGMSMGELCEATLTTSDNVAANLILASYGGPAALTAFARSIGDTVTRFDRNEPSANIWHGEHDTTTPRAAVHGMQRVLLGDVLTPKSREQLRQWMLAATTGTKRLKAGLPAGWTIADRTGAASDKNDGGTSNDIAVVWPPGSGAPLLVTAYLTRSSASFEARNATLAQVGHLLPLIVDQRTTR